jgi:hypothetical protein
LQVFGGFTGNVKAQKENPGKVKKDNGNVEYADVHQTEGVKGGRISEENKQSSIAIKILISQRRTGGSGNHFRLADHHCTGP